MALLQLHPLGVANQPTYLHEPKYTHKASVYHRYLDSGLYDVRRYSTAFNAYKSNVERCDPRLSSGFMVITDYRDAKRHFAAMLRISTRPAQHATCSVPLAPRYNGSWLRYRCSIKNGTLPIMVMIVLAPLYRGFFFLRAPPSGASRCSHPTRFPSYYQLLRFHVFPCFLRVLGRVCCYLLHMRILKS